MHHALETQCSGYLPHMKTRWDSAQSIGLHVKPRPFSPSHSRSLRCPISSLPKRLHILIFDENPLACSQEVLRVNYTTDTTMEACGMEYCVGLRLLRTVCTLGGFPIVVLRRQISSPNSTYRPSEIAGKLHSKGYRLVKRQSGGKRGVNGSWLRPMLVVDGDTRRCPCRGFRLSGVVLNVCRYR